MFTHPEPHRPPSPLGLVFLTLFFIGALTLVAVLVHRHQRPADGVKPLTLALPAEHCQPPLAGQVLVVTVTPHLSGHTIHCQITSPRRP